MGRTWLTTLAAAAGTAAAYHLLVRPRILRRGATDEEAARALPGDEVAPPGSSRSTMATTIAATPEQIWPWLAQVGWGRAAFYSYNRIENLIGMDTHNADRVHPEWQGLQVGDTMWMSHPRLKYLFPETKVVEIDPNKALVFAIHGPEGTDAPPTGTWSFVLEPVDDASTRLISRLQVNPPPLLGKLIIYGFMEPAHLIMQSGMFRGLNARIESERRSPDRRGATATDTQVDVGAGRDAPVEAEPPEAAPSTPGEWGR
jgi:hypothetical protein